MKTKPTPYSILQAHPILGIIVKAIDEHLEKFFGMMPGTDFDLSRCWKKEIYEKDVERALLDPQTAELIASVYRPEWKATLCGNAAEGFVIKFGHLKQHLKLS